MTNLECAIATLAAHREARRWADEAVAVDLLAQLGVDPVGEVRPPGAPADLMTVAEAEAAAKEATAKASGIPAFALPMPADPAPGDPTHTEDQT